MMCHRIVLVGLALAASSPDSAESQGYPFSQRGAVGQTVAFTDITVAYGRPVARGRVLFGQLVPWDRVWNPGADSATRVTFSRDVLVEDQALPAGEYSLWLIPRERAPWTLVFSRAARVFHTPYPGEDSDALRVDVPADSASHLESMMIYFPFVQRADAVMRIHWGTTFVAARITAPYEPD
jgi:hypothetical protein